MHVSIDRWNEWNKSGGPKYPHEKVIQFLFRQFPSHDQRAALHVLDLGCGGGVHMEFLAREGFHAHGRDISPIAIETTRRRLEDLDLKAASLETCSVNKINAPSESFDALICIGVLECAGPEFLLPALYESIRVLKPRGSALFLFASDSDFRLAEDNPLSLHGFSDHELSIAIASLTGCIQAFWCDRYITTYRNQQLVQSEHLVTIMK